MFYRITKLRLRSIIFFAAIVCVAFSIVIYLSLLPIPSSLSPEPGKGIKAQVTCRDGTPLSWTLDNKWNYTDLRSISNVPPFLIHSILAAEDRNFFFHGGSDFKALLSAMFQNLVSRRVIRGASTISEQVIKLLHPRPRTVFSRLLEILEAQQLESRFSKLDILEFYLNQVPFPNNRRGINAGAAELFNRSLETLSKKEMLALAVLIRNPGLLSDVKVKASRNELLNKRILNLAEFLRSKENLSEPELEDIADEELRYEKPKLRISAPHFVRYILSEEKEAGSNEPTLHSTIDPSIQDRVQKLLDNRIKAMASRGVSNGSVLVIDNNTNEVLSWANGSASSGSVSEIDSVITPRQPGSTLKPFLYALALSGGWTPATIIDDYPVIRPVGLGVKEYRNYSGRFHGPIRLREALGNSLNVPAIKTVEFVGRENLYDFLHEIGFTSLSKESDFYGDGLALGNGEVTLLELVQAYSMLAHNGLYRPLIKRFDSKKLSEEKQVVSKEVASLISSILSDPQARTLEFSSDDLLSMPFQAAVKTGTSTDYRDAWAVGYTSRFTVGIWMGNLDRTPMLEVTGSTGPSLLLRSILSFLERFGTSRALYLSPTLIKERICSDTGEKAGCGCPEKDEWFIPGTAPEELCSVRNKNRSRPTNFRIQMPSPGLLLARDPRIPDEFQEFPFELNSESVSKVMWYVNEQLVGHSESPRGKFLWRVRRGRHQAKALVLLADSGNTYETESVSFTVK